MLISRCLPIIRTFISLPAGSRWEEWHRRIEVLDYLVAAGILAAALYLLVRWRRSRILIS